MLEYFNMSAVTQDYHHDWDEHHWVVDNQIHTSLPHVKISRLPVYIMFGRPPEAEGASCSVMSADNTVGNMSCNNSWVGRLLWHESPWKWVLGSWSSRATQSIVWFHEDSRGNSISHGLMKRPFKVLTLVNCIFYVCVTDCLTYVFNCILLWLLVYFSSVFTLVQPPQATIFL